MRTRRFLSTALIAGAVLAAAALAHAQQPQARDGVQVGERRAASPAWCRAGEGRAFGRRAIRPAQREAASKGALAPANHPQVQRLRGIADRLVPYASRFNERAPQWKWEVNLIGSKQINAFCMPGGKIAFFSGIIDTLKLTDDEIATIMGHEIAHALREHGRERAAKSTIAQGVTWVRRCCRS